MLQLGELGTFQTGPVVYDGVVYAHPPEHLRNRRNQLPKAVEPSAHCARTGDERDHTGRGAGRRRVIRGAQDGFVYALDAKTGELLWERRVADWSIGEGIGAAPLV